MKASPVLLLPGWLNSGPEHWQSRWEALHGHRRVEQDDWLWPRRGDWMARLDEVLLGSAQPQIGRLVDALAVSTPALPLISTRMPASLRP